MVVVGRIGRRGFSLIELLVVISILALLVSIILPSFRSARRQAKMTVCATNLKQIGVAMGEYLASHGDRFPFASMFPSMGALPLEGDEPVYIADVLAAELKNELDVFECPDDRPGKYLRDMPNTGKSYFQSERSSFEYRIMIGPPRGGRTFEDMRLPGKTIDEISRLIELVVEQPASPSAIWYFRDWNGFHAQKGKSQSRNYLHLDGHVADFERY